MRVESHQKSNQSSWHFAGADPDEIASLRQALKAMEEDKEDWKHKFQSMRAQFCEKAMEVSALHVEVADLKSELYSKQKESQARADLIAALGLDKISQQLKDDLVENTTNDGSLPVAITSHVSGESGKETATQFSTKSDTSTAVAQEHIDGIYEEMQNCITHAISMKEDTKILGTVALLARAIKITWQHVQLNNDNSAAFPDQASPKSDSNDLLRSGESSSDTGNESGGSTGSMTVFVRGECSQH